jgi:Calx-beta domain/Beta-propeller repeat
MKSNNPPLSRLQRSVLVIGIACLLATFAGVILVGAQYDNNLPAADPAVTAPDKARLTEKFARLPLSFEINKGQIDQRVKFLSHGAGYDLFLTANEAVLKVQKARDAKADENVSEGSVLRLKLLGTNATPQVEGQQELPGKVNYFNGNDPEKWRRNIPTYQRVQFKEVYPGIDLVYYGNQRELEYDLVVAARANPKLIRFSVEGADQIRLDKTGKLLLGLKHGEVSLNKPFIYQLDENGSRREVKGAYVVNGNEVRFKLDRFDSSKPLVIDPVLTYSTLLGSGSNDVANAIAVDSQGSAYVTGNTDVSTFPTTAGAFKTTNALGGAFVTKLDPTGSTLIYSTYLTGEGRATGLGIAVDSTGNAYITGTTSAENFPIVNGLKTGSTFFKTTDAAANWNNLNSGLRGAVHVIAVAPSAPNTIYAGGNDGFFRSTDGGATWTKTPSTGLQGFSFADDMVVDPTNSSVVYVADSLLFKSTDGGNNWSVVNITVNFGFLSAIRFDPSTPSTIYIGARNGVFKSTDSGSTWTLQNNFGIPGTPVVRALAIDPTAPLTLYAGTSDNGLFKSTNGGGVWTAMNNGMGGGNPNLVTAIAIDPTNTATVYTGHGETPGAGGINKSTNGGASWTPLTNGVPNAGVHTIVATSSAVYAAVNSKGVIKTTNGGSSWTNVTTGLWSTSVSSLVTQPSDPAILYAGTSGTGLADAFVTKLNASGSGVLFSTFVGGTNEDIGNSIAVDGSGTITIAGQTSSTNFPVVNAIHPSVTFNGNCATGFVTKLNPAVPSYTFSTYLGGGQCDAANSVATDGSGNIYVTGRTFSTDFPTANAFQPALAGQTQFPKADAFVTKLTPGGSLIYSTYLGGTDEDVGFGIAADSSGNAYVTGVTNSSNFPTMNPIQASIGGTTSDVFVTKLNSTGSVLVYSTYLGGTGFESGRGIAVDSANNAYITGVSSSFEFPLVAGALRTKSPMYKSIDGAASWTNDNYGFTGATISSMAIHPLEPSTLYVGTQSGVFKSINGGRTWAAINNGLTNLNVTALVMDPSAPNTLYIAISGIQSGSGVYKSTDGGSSWNLRNNGISANDLRTLAIDPVTPNTLYLSVSFCCVVGPHIFKTTDGANNWVPIGNPPPARPSLPASFAVDPLNHTTIYVADVVSPGGFYKSTDAGLTWQALNVGHTISEGRFIAVSPLTPGLVLGSSDQNVFRSVDGGNNWSVVLSIGGKIVFDPVNSSIVYLVSTKPFALASRGVFKSTDSGQTWVAMNKGLNEPTASALVIDPLKPSTLYLASVPSGGIDGFVTKINPAGSALVYSTFIGGPLKDPLLSISSALPFGIALDSASNAYITGSASSPGFPVTPNGYQPFNRGGDDAFIAKLGTSYIISGRVLNNGAPGAPLRDAEIVLNDGRSLTSVLSESDGSYQFSGLREGGNYTVSVAKPHFIFTPSSQTFNNLNSDHVLDFSAITSDSEFRTISGQATENGVSLAGVTVTLSGSQSGLRTTDSNGNYSYELIVPGNYTVTPSLPGFSFGPASQTLNGLNANQTANFTATRQNFVVTNINNHGSGSLREAIINANATVGTDTIVFNIPGPGVKTINPLIALPEITDRIVIDGTTQPGYAGTPLIELDGTGLGFTSGHGLLIKAGGSTVRGLAIGNFRSGNGIVLQDCDNNVIQSNYIGIAPDGTTARANVRGIVVNNSDHNMIGGTTAAARNVLSGNNNGIQITGAANTIQGNFVGTNAAGTAAVRNVGGVDILSADSTDNLIGGTAPGAGNLISGNEFGLENHGNRTIIQGNLIGTDITGTNKIPNANGIQSISLNTLIGGLVPGARNVISGSTANGVYLRGAGNKLQGNYIGTDITGTLPMGNSGTGVIAGETALIGGTQPEARNIISANGGIGNNGNVALGINNSGPAALVQGNYIGTDVTGTRALGGSPAGITIISNNNVIGGTVAGARNVISGNTVGIQVGTLFSGLPTGSVIQGNIIGLNALGSGPLPNTQQGIAIAGGTNSVIGGTPSGAGNQIAFNGGPGIAISAGTGHSIRGNSIFSNNGLGIDLGANGVTANDDSDPDTGPNNLQNFPVITSVLSSANSMTIQGSLKSTPNATVQIDFFSNAAVDPSGNGEGAQFVNSTSIDTDGNGNATINATFSVGLPAGRVITATATDPNGNTSEFSAADSASTSGSVQFSVSSIVAIEDVGSLPITVLRTGGAAGSMTVDYATADGTAIAGQDYTATSGTLTFNAGETSKTIQIPILDDATTEADENFTVVLRNASTLEALGAPNTLLVTLLDHSTTPFVFINDIAVVEGNTGTTEAVFTINLTAASGHAVSGNYTTTANSTAFGGAKCSDQGVDYETTSGTFSFQPGTTTFTIPIKICGDTSAEANETVRLTLSNLSGATFFDSVAVGTIINDDVLELVLEESGPSPSQAAALDSYFAVRDPFRVLGIPEWFVGAPDQNTRATLFARGLQLNFGEVPSAVVVRIIASNSQVFDVSAEDVRSIPGTDLTQVVIRLPNNLVAGTCSVSIRAHTRVSNTGTIRIVP